MSRRGTDVDDEYWSDAVDSDNVENSFVEFSNTSKTEGFLSCIILRQNPL